MQIEMARTLQWPTGRQGVPRVLSVGDVWSLACVAILVGGVNERRSLRRTLADLVHTPDREALAASVNADGAWWAHGPADLKLDTASIVVPVAMFLAVEREVFGPSWAFDIEAKEAA